MNILCCLNDKYFYPMITMISSIRRFNKDKLNLFIITSDFNKKYENKLLKFCSSRDIEVKIFRQSANEYATGNSHYSIDMYFRIFAFSILPENVEKVLYLDADLIFQDNISNLYNVELNDKFIGVARDKDYGSDYLHKHKNKLNIRHDYFNSGVILFNLKNIRNKFSESDITKAIEENNDKIMYPDQDILNILYEENEILFLDKKFNHQLQYNDKPNIEGTTIIHYVGWIKPWTHLNLSDHELKYWDIFKDVKMPIHYFKQHIKMLFFPCKKAIRKFKRIIKNKK